MCLGPSLETHCMHGWKAYRSAYRQGLIGCVTHIALHLTCSEAFKMQYSIAVYIQYAETCQIKSSSLTWTWSRKGNPFRSTSGSFKVSRDKQPTFVASITQFRVELTRFPLFSASALNCFCCVLYCYRSRTVQMLDSVRTIAYTKFSLLLSKWNSM